MNINLLQEKYQTDKFNLGYFDGIYDKILPKYIGSTENILEIGTHDGESILLWSYLFNNAKIYGVDIKPCPKIQNIDNISHIIGDAYHETLCNQFEDNFFDIIIDDGPHTLNSFIFLIENYITKLKNGGVMIIEDIIDLNWTKILSEKLDTHKNITYKIYNMANKQKTDYLLNLWSGGLDVICIYKLKS